MKRIPQQIKHTLYLLLAAVMPVFAQNQQDSEAKKLLDQLSEKTKSYQSIYIEFESAFDNVEENIHQSTSGTLMTSGNKFILEIPGTKVISDGTTNWTIQEEVEEVLISDVSEEGAINLTQMLSIYEEGYDFQMGEKKENLQSIKLYPQDKDSEVHQILLTLDVEKMQIVSIVEMVKNGTLTSYQIKNFRTNFNKEVSFSFDPKQYPDFYIEDMR